MMKHSYPLILATDLDGTFLEGDFQLKQWVYSELLRLKEQIILIYVTGRGIDSVQELCLEGYLPMPHCILGDHGTHIVNGNTFDPIHILQESIITQWNNANDKIKNLLVGELGIELQPFNTPYRVAYYYDANLLQPETIQKITNAGFDVVLSCGVYLDILPRGVNKGTSLLKVIEHMALEHDSVVVCGDSLNDLSLFQTNLKSIVVGNAEEALLTETQTLTNVYHSAFPGLLGILDGLKFYCKHNLFSINHLLPF